jgi:hypothetical protein
MRFGSTSPSLGERTFLERRHETQPRVPFVIAVLMPVAASCD